MGSLQLWAHSHSRSSEAPGFYLSLSGQHVSFISFFSFLFSFDKDSRCLGRQVWLSGVAVRPWPPLQRFLLSCPHFWKDRGGVTFGHGSSAWSLLSHRPLHSWLQCAAHYLQCVFCFHWVATTKKTRVEDMCGNRHFFRSYITEQRELMEDMQSNKE